MGDILAFSSLHVELSYFVLFELLLFFMSGSNSLILESQDSYFPDMFNGTLNEAHLFLFFQFIIHSNFPNQLCTLNNLTKSD